MVKLTLTKSEILRSKKSIEGLFEQRKGFIQYPLRCVYKYTTPESDSDSESEDSNNVNSTQSQVLFVVSKRYHKRAVKRNLMRRRIKEAYRIEKPAFMDALSELNVSNIEIALLYIGKEEAPYSQIEKSVNKIFNNVYNYIKKSLDIPTPPVG